MISLSFPKRCASRSLFTYTSRWIACRIYPIKRFCEMECCPRADIRNRTWSSIAILVVSILFSPRSPFLRMTCLEVGRRFQNHSWTTSASTFETSRMPRAPFSMQFRSERQKLVGGTYTKLHRSTAVTPLVEKSTGSFRRMVGAEDVVRSSLRSVRFGSSNRTWVVITDPSIRHTLLPELFLL